MGEGVEGGVMSYIMLTIVDFGVLGEGCGRIQFRRLEFRLHVFRFSNYADSAESRLPSLLDKWFASHEGVVFRGCDVHINHGASHQCPFLYTICSDSRYETYMVGFVLGVLHRNPPGNSPKQITLSIKTLKVLQS